MPLAGVQSTLAEESEVTVPVTEDEDQEDSPPQPPPPDELERLEILLWQREEKQWILRKIHLAAFQHLCHARGLDWTGTKETLYSRVQPVVRPYV